MKLLHKDIEKDNAGQVTLMPEEAEDMWHTYNLVQVGDSLRASTIRKVQTESSTGSVGSSRVRTTLTVSVEAIDFDSQACQLRVKGTNIEENQYVKMGAYHTIELELNRKFTLAKKVWDSVVLDRIDQACDPAQKADVAAVVMQEGLANLVLVTPAMTLLRAKVEVTIPRKRRGSCTQHEKALERFYEAVMQGILRHFNFDEVLSDPAVTSRLSDTKAASEVKALEDFYKILQHEPDKAFYGLSHVERASEALAIDVLLISDKLFRHQDIATRSRYVRLVDSVRDNGGTVRIFSSLHVSGEQLTQLSGVAAILRFPIADPSDVEDEDSSSDEA
ncbi:protein pelota homolog isoform X2 [Brachyhypopomus gauderio]|uniref:protein pelota homolog isoform X2 n=1 Tax=Brachyhypopomus gauderio TaxID=698409 RepID=UPI004042203F